VEVAKALGGSFKLVTLAPKTVRKMTQAPLYPHRTLWRYTNIVLLLLSTAHGNIKEWGQTNKSKSTNEHTKHKPKHTKKTTELEWYSLEHIPPPS